MPVRIHPGLCYPDFIAFHLSITSLLHNMLSVLFCGTPCSSATVTLVIYCHLSEHVICHLPVPMVVVAVWLDSQLLVALTAGLECLDVDGFAQFLFTYGVLVNICTSLADDNMQFCCSSFMHEDVLNEVLYLLLE